MRLALLLQDACCSRAFPLSQRAVWRSPCASARRPLQPAPLPAACSGASESLAPWRLQELCATKAFFEHKSCCERQICPQPSQKGSVSGCALEARKERGACELGQVLPEKLWDLGPIESWGKHTPRG